MVLALNFDSKEELQLKEERSSEQYEHITIYYPEDFAELLPLTKETLDWAFNKNEEIFGIVDEVPLDFIVANSSDELESFSGLKDISGFYSDFDKVMAITYENKDAILEKLETPLYYFQKSILHEYTHYVMARLVNGSKKGMEPYPIWFYEGICEYVGNDQTTIEYTGFKLVSFKDLITTEQWRDARFEDGTEVYFQSYFAIEYLIATFGTDILSNIIQHANSIGDFSCLSN